MGKKPTPKQKHARASGKHRYGRFQYEARKRLLNMVHLVPCGNCGKQTVSHMMCPNCGQYRGRLVMDMTPKVKKKITTVTA